MSPKTQPDNRCQHVSANGRCRAPRAKGDAALCRQHQRQQLELQADHKAVAAELLGPIEDFNTANAVNQVLGKLLALLASNRIAPRRAGAIAYVCQLLLNTLPGVEREITCTKGGESWERTLRQTLRELRNARTSEQGAAPAPREAARAAS